MPEGLNTPIGWLVIYFDQSVVRKSIPAAFMVLDPAMPPERLKELLRDWSITAQVTHYLRDKDAKEAALDYAEKQLVGKSVATCWHCQGTGTSTTAIRVAGGRPREQTSTCKECVGRGIKVNWYTLLLEIVSSWLSDGALPVHLRRGLTITVKDRYIVSENEKGVLIFKHWSEEGAVPSYLPVRARDL